MDGVINLVGEEWREVPGFPAYEASSYGRVRSWKRRGAGSGRQAARPRLLSPSDTGHGYLQVTLSRDGELHYMHVHRLVAEAFHGTRPPGMQVRHLDGDNSNNTPENLSFGTQEENNEDRNRHGNLPRGEGHYKAKLSEAQVQAILRSPAPSSRLAAKYGVTKAAIYGVRVGKSWREVFNRMSDEGTNLYARKEDA